jgi:hypothetical protein
MASSRQVMNYHINDMNRTINNIAANMHPMAKLMKVLPF